METLVNYWEFKPEVSYNGKTNQERIDYISKLCEENQKDVWMKIYTELSDSEMNAGYRQEKTFNGYPIDIIKSALQKYIRRGAYGKAIYAGIELDLFAYCPDKRAEGLRTNMIHRLMIIFLEDVCNPNLLTQLNEDIFTLINLKKQRRGLDINSSKFRSIRKREESLLPKIIYNLAASSHTRMVSYLRSVIGRYNLSKNNAKFWALIKSMYSGMDYFIRDIDSDQIYPDFMMSFPLFPGEEKIERQVKNFISCLEQKSLYAIYWAIQIVEGIDKVHPREPRKTNPVYLVFAIIEKYIQLRKYQNKEEYIKTLEICKRWFNELYPLKEAALTYVYMILISNYDGNLNSIDPEKMNFQCDKRYLINLLKTKIDIEDFVIDQHTLKGKKEGSGHTEFALVGSLVSNEVYVGKSEVLKSIYVDSKLLVDHNLCEVLDFRRDHHKKINKKYFPDEALPPGYEYDKLKLPEAPPGKKIGIYNCSERGNFILKARAQLVTAKYKPDTYFAFDMRGEYPNVLVKGPYRNKEIVERIIDLGSYKFQAKINAVYMEMRMLRPDMFYEDEHPLGSRNLIDKDELHPFLICEDLFDIINYPKKMVESKVWGITFVVDWSKVTPDKSKCSHLDSRGLFEKDPELFAQYVLALFYRYIFGISDLADRNFLVVNRAVYSIDEDTYNKDINMKNELRKDIIEDILQFLKEYNLEEIVKYWYAVFLQKYECKTEEEKESIKKRFEIMITNPESVFQ